MPRMGRDSLRFDELALLRSTCILKMLLSGRVEKLLLVVAIFS